MTVAAQLGTENSGERRAARLRLGLGMMTAASVLVLAVAAWVPWHSVLGVDNRTYVEMIAGVARSGLPCLANGPAAEFPELRARFNVVARGRLCAAYPPVFAYVAQPAFRLGGIRGVIRFNIALLGVVAWLAFWIALRLFNDVRDAAIAGVLTLSSSTMLMMASDASSYTLGIAFALASVGFAIESRTARGGRMGIFALSAGIAGGLAFGTQLLVAPIALATLATTAVARARDESPLLSISARFVEWIPSSGSLRRAGIMVGGFAIPLVLLALINHARFGTLSPLGGGGCPWRSCNATGIANQAPGVMLGYAAPVLAWAGLWVVSALIAGPSRRARVSIAAVFLLMLAGRGTLHEHAVGLGQLAWGFIVDLTPIDMGDFWRPPDHVGVFLGPFLVRSSMQSVPAIALAVAFRVKDPDTRRTAAFIATSAAALYASLVMRATIPNVYALGFPFVSLRYVSPAIPLLVILAVGAVRELPWRREHAMGLVVLSCLLVIGFARSHGDDSWVRRILLVRVFPLVGLVGALLAFRHAHQSKPTWDHALMAVAVLAFAFGIGATLGIDARAVFDVRRGNDLRVDMVARAAPQRFAVLGWPREIDTPLVLRASRDVEYADFYETPNWVNIPTLIQRWLAEHRPVLALWNNNDAAVNQWPGLRMVLIDASEHIYRIEPAPAPQPPSGR